MLIRFLAELCNRFETVWVIRSLFIMTAVSSVQATLRFCLKTGNVH